MAYLVREGSCRRRTRTLAGGGGWGHSHASDGSVFRGVGVIDLQRSLAGVKIFHYKTQFCIFRA